MAILLKLGPNYLVFVSTFHATQLTTRAWKMPKIVDFMESLTQEQDKLVMMGTIKPSKYQALVVGDSRVDSKFKKKSKNPLEKKRDKNKSQEDPQGSKKKSQKKKKKGEMSKCTYCSKGFHPESSYMKKQIDMLTQILKKNNISFLIAQRRGKEDQIQKTRREYMIWLLTPQAHLASSLILEHLDIWF